MPKPLLLSLQVTDILTSRRYLHRDALDDHTSLGQGLQFSGAIGHQTGVGNMQLMQYFGGNSIGACIDGIPEVLISLDSIVSLVLQGIRLQFRCQSDAATFLWQVEQHSPTFCGDGSESGMHLGLAITALRAEEIPCGTGGMQAQQRRLFLPIL